MDKKTTQITIHCSAEMRIALQGIAEKRGKTESELGREIIGKFLKSQFDELSVLNKYFKANSSSSLSRISSQKDQRIQYA